MLATDLKKLVAQYGADDGGQSSVLIVDDELPNLMVLRGFLDADYTVYEAQSGPEALRIAAEHQMAVVIADQRMPEMTGIEMLEKLRQTQPDAVGIVLTGYTDTPALISAINQARVFRFLKKPWQPEELLAAVQQGCDSAFQARALRNLVGLLAHRTDELQASLEKVQTAHEQLLHLERLSTMGRLASGLTHDLRNVMVSVNHIERELETRAAEPDLLESVQIGTHMIGNLLQTLEGMQQFAKSGALTMASELFAPAQVVQAAIAISRMDMTYRARKVDVEIEKDLPAVQGDQQKLIQVLVNLLRNAIQATEKSKRILVRAQRDAGEVVFAVEDEGPGVPSELRDKIFEPFVSTKGDKGMGMGLYMARLIVESHQGQIRCSNRPAGGARFEVRLKPAA
ncbi:MAG: hybrid sensor histidine kinase/response regulator [Deltaproteobacteria bacterium]|nr:MAG: hybrid sensor histidine kinase/response regulator [Deltaproteobacteria bacterium]